MPYVAILVVGTCCNLQLQLAWLSMSYGGDECANATSFALVMARPTPLLINLLEEAKYLPRPIYLPNRGSDFHSERPCQRGSINSCSWSAGRISHFSPHPLQSPWQSSRHIGFMGSARITASRTGISRSAISPSIINSSSSPARFS